MTYYIEETFQKIAKPGYVRVTDHSGKLISYCPYEDILFNEAMRNNLARKIEYDRFRLYCACTADDNASVEIGMNGEIRTEKGGHTAECAYFQGRIRRLIEDRPAISGLMRINGRILVDYKWFEGKKPQIDVLRKENIRPFDKKLSFSSWVAINNILAMNYRSKGINGYSGDYKSQAADAIFQMGVHPIVYENTRQGVKEECRFSKTDFYTPEIPDGGRGLIYGPITEIPKKYIDNEDSKYMWIRVYSVHKGKTVGIRLPKDMFLDQIEKLPLKDDIWICGYVGALMFPQVSAFRTHMGPAKVKAKAKIKREREYYRADAMILGIIFNCNKAGMIVFSKEEYDTSNEAIDQGKILYRSLLSHPGTGADLVIMEYRKDDIDAPLLS